MNSVLAIAGALTIGYLIGSLPIGYLLVFLFKGEDLRQHGSGRTGGTNAMRAAGAVVGILTALGDLVKGAGAVWVARALFQDSAVLPWSEVLGGAAAVVGHNWSIFLGLRGGAGTGPNVGVAMALWPGFAFSLIPAGVAVFLLHRLCVGDIPGRCHFHTGRICPTSRCRGWILGSPALWHLDRYICRAGVVAQYPTFAGRH